MGKVSVAQPMQDNSFHIPSTFSSIYHIKYLMTVLLFINVLLKVARLVKVTQADSPYFKIISPPDVGHKVAPGMDTVFLIKFFPDEKKVGKI